jgi:hypothetical protein
MFIFTDYCERWQPHHFKEYIYNNEYIKVDPDYVERRPARMATDLAGALANMKGMRILDYGSGSGVFAGKLRSAGFSRVESYDPFSMPVRPEGKFDLVTCFEVLEHAPNPVETFQQIKSFMHEQSCVVATTESQPPDIEKVRANWPYAAPRNGHVSLYSVSSLVELGNRFDLAYCQGQSHYKAFVPRQRSSFADEVFSLFGPAWEAPLLLSPNEDLLEASDWHTAERGPRGAFRWSKTNSMTWNWRPKTLPCIVRAQVPIVMEVRKDFTSDAAFVVNGQRYPTTRSGSHLVAECQVNGPGDGKVLLVTQEPARPIDIRRSSDARSLGIAVPCNAAHAG